ncbi:MULTISPECIES: hypothetical protein [Pseudomonadaceae]|uniref:Polymerase n=2 Tax=Pseudomonadaceae TaxID=135621 RepID=A0A1G5N5F7_9PSED|nr:MULTISPECIES: hypothetical protein [Pseudomonas]KIZ51358.1 hypothetical protein UM91_07035 [Pseudomonas oryzihabitans]MBA1212330.1 hypothetical protein [Pseudomonas psychrotolerans]MBA1258039.1 hypothetical protein [Pseudomonas psychrotolerans]MBH3328666.1 hypothetical protein [Pseudomonas oryzihabitans]MDK4199951.1 hypothetical protein [Pseudomonas sp. HR1]
MPGTLINRLSFLALGGLMVLQFGVFEQSPTNPVGIRYVGELYLAICLGFFALFTLSTWHRPQRDYRLLMGFCLFSTAVFVGLPAVFAQLFWGQPLVYGLIEERRVLYCFSAFLVLYLAKRLNAVQFENLIILVGLLSALLCWLSYFKMLPDLREEVKDLSRPGRASTGAGAIFFGYFICIYFAGRGRSFIDGQLRPKLRHGLLALFFLATIVVVLQTRQLIVVCLVFTILALRARLVGPALFGAIIIAPLILYPHLLETLGFNLDFYARSVQEGPTDNVRENTISQIINHLQLYNGLPSGSLSLMWNDGFKPIFGDYFFLSDVGIFGTVFRFGFLSILVIPIGLAVHYLVARKLSRDLEFTLAVFLAFMTIWPLQGLFEYQGTAALLFVMQALKTYHGAPQYGVISLPERPGALPPGRQVLPV